ncbi:MAG: hypothetical protein Q9218_005850 [Villophora microphyllina]
MDGTTGRQGPSQASPKRVSSLLEYATHMPEPFHVICGQDPSSQLPWLSTGAWVLWYGGGKELSDDDDPRLSRDAPREKRLMKTRVGSWVHNSILHHEWGVIKHDSTDLVATLRLKTVSGYIDFHNVYNHQTELKIPDLMDICDGTGAQSLLRDFNLNHQSWSGDTMSCDVEPAAVELHNGTSAAGIQLLSTRGAITYSRSACMDQNSSTIDLVLGSYTVTTMDPRWELLDVEGFESDYRVTQTAFDIDTDYSIRAGFDWKRADKRKVRSAVKDRRQSLEQRVLISASDMNAYAGLVAGARRKFTRAKLVRWRAFVSAKKDVRGMFRLSGLGQRMCQPKRAPHLESFVVGNTRCDSSVEMSKVHRDHLWPSTDDNEATSIQLPQAGPREQYDSPQKLLDGELIRLINKLKTGKAAGIDRVGNDFLKLTKDIILPYLEHLFTACIA